MPNYPRSHRTTRRGDGLGGVTNDENSVAFRIMSTEGLGLGGRLGQRGGWGGGCGSGAIYVGVRVMLVVKRG